MAINLSIDQSIQLKSILVSLLCIFEKLIELTKEKQKSILNMDWNNVFLIANEQAEIVNFLNKKDKELKEFYSVLKKIEDKDIVSIKQKLKEYVEQYKQMENTNSQLLSDHLFTAKQKLEKLFNIKINNDTYTRDMKKINNIWENSAVVLNKVI